MMTVDFDKLSAIVSPNLVQTDEKVLRNRYCTPHPNQDSPTPMAAVYPINIGQVTALIRYFHTINNINVIITSSKTDPKFLGDTSPSKNTIILDLSMMVQIPFINKRNKVCVVEPGVTWAALKNALEGEGLRPRAPFLPRKGKSALASVLEREPHLCPKAQFDISDPLLCMEVVFGNGEPFRTGEAAGPQSIEVNRAVGAALTNPLGPGQTDIFRLIQGSKGTYGCVTWISMQCDFIPSTRCIRFIQSDTLPPLTEFIYAAVRRRIVDEIFIINNHLFRAIFPSMTGSTKQFILIYAINGYELFPEDKLAYQITDCAELFSELGLDAVETLAGIQQEDLAPLLDGQTVDPHPKSSDARIAVDAFYSTTLNRIDNHIDAIENILRTYQFPLNRVNMYFQPLIQARAAHVEFSLIADRPPLSVNTPTSYDTVCQIVRAIAQYITSNGGFFSRPYKLIQEYAFKGHEVHVDGLRRLKAIFDPDAILNKGELCF